MLKLRVLTVACLLPLLLAAIFLLPGIGWQIALLPPLLVAANEWSALAGIGGLAKALFLSVLAAGTGLMSMAAIPDTAGAASTVIWPHTIYAISAGFWLVVAPCWLWLGVRLRSRLALGIAGLVVLMPLWLALVQLQNHPAMLLLLLCVVWLADTAAYFTGHNFGKNKLAPHISPGKTWEGVGGALLAVTVYALVLCFARFAERDPVFVLAAFLSMTILSIVGDLFESWLKRCAGVKDSGAILPGHGGMLDRIDGLVAAMPLATLLFM